MTRVPAIVTVMLLLATGSVVSAHDVRMSQASPWAPGYESPLRSAITDGVVRWITDDDRLGLSDAQVERVEALAEEHRRRFERWLDSIADDVRKHQEAVREARGGTIENLDARLEREQAFAPMADRQAELDERFLREVDSILEDDQIAAWRHWRHRYTMARWQENARLMDAAVDLVALIEQVERELDLDALRDDDDHDVDDLDALVTEYAAAMHRALTEMATAAIERSRHRMRSREERYMTDGERVWLGPHPDGSEGMRAMALERHETFERVRRVNRQYLDAIRATLPAEARAAFTDAWQRRILHLGRNEARRYDVNFWFCDAVGIVRSFDDLTDEQAETLDALAVEYRDRMNARLRTLIRRQESMLRARVGLDGGGRDARDRAEEAYFDEFDDVVLEYDRAMIESLREILTDEQRERFDDERPAEQDGGPRSRWPG